VEGSGGSAYLKAFQHLCYLFCLSLGKPRRKWEDNIKMDLREVGWGGIDWIDLT
jgi:hypothetical protein